MKFLFSNLLNDGGPLFMYTNLLILLVCIVLIGLVFLKGDASNKITQTVKHLSLFAIAWGFLGLFIGLIGAFDSIESYGSVAPEVLASGLKVGLLAPSFGIFVFLVVRLGIIALVLKKK